MLSDLTRTAPHNQAYNCRTVKHTITDVVCFIISLFTVFNPVTQAGEIDGIERIRDVVPTLVHPYVTCTLKQRYRMDVETIELLVC